MFIEFFCSFACKMGAKEKARPGPLSTPGIGTERPCSEPDL
jgi:hypothetical protein